LYTTAVSAGILAQPRSETRHGWVAGDGGSHPHYETVAHGGAGSLGPRILKQYFDAGLDVITELERVVWH
jgi:hypothetical protein